MDALPGEHRLAGFRPHLLSFLPAHLTALLPAAWAVATAWIVRTSGWTTFWQKLDWSLFGITPEVFAGYAVLLVGLLALSAAVAVVRIRWGLWFVHLAVALAAILVGHNVFDGDHRTVAPLLLASSSLVFLVLVEADRLSHRYVLTTHRILFSGGAFGTKERQLRYESVTDLDSTQGPLGFLFGYGTIIPVTQSGFGLGDDSSQANIAVGAVSKKGPAIGVSAGGGRSVQVGRARTFHQLTGAHPFRKVKRIVEQQLHAGSQATLLRSQLDLQNRTLETLQRQEQALADVRSRSSQPPLPPPAVRTSGPVRPVTPPPFERR